MMVERVGVHGAHQTQVVGTGTQMRQQLRQLGAALAMTLKLKLAGHDRSRGLNEGKIQVLGQRRRQR
jgi:hypothetical protein